MPDNQDYHKRPPKPQTAHRPPWPCAAIHIQAGGFGPMSSLVDTSQDYFSEQQRPLLHFSLEVSLVSTSRVCAPEVPIPMSLSLLFGGSNRIVSLSSLMGTSSLILSPLPPTGHQPPSHIATASALGPSTALASFSYPLAFLWARPPANHPTLGSVTETEKLEKLVVLELRDARSCLQSGSRGIYILRCLPLPDRNGSWGEPYFSPLLWCVLKGGMEKRDC